MVRRRSDDAPLRQQQRRCGRPVPGAAWTGAGARGGLDRSAVPGAAWTVLKSCESTVVVTSHRGPAPGRRTPANIMTTLARARVLAVGLLLVAYAGRNLRRDAIPSSSPSAGVALGGGRSGPLLLEGPRRGPPPPPGRSPPARADASRMALAHLPDDGHETGQPGHLGDQVTVRRDGPESVGGAPAVPAGWGVDGSGRGLAGGELARPGEDPGSSWTGWARSSRTDSTLSSG